MIRGEVWLVDFDPTIADEIKKMRPCTIVCNDSAGFLALKIVVPFTDWKELYQFKDWMARIEPNAGNGLSKVSAADTF